MNTVETRLAEIKNRTDDTPVLNPAQLDQIRSLDTSGEHKLLRRILQTFLESTEGYIRQLEQAIINGDTDALYRTTHTEVQFGYYWR